MLEMQGQPATLHLNGTSCSEREEIMLRIHLIGTNDPSEVFPTPVVSTVPDHLKHLELENFGIAEFLTFRPPDHLNLSKSQRTFVRRIQDVVLSRLDTENRLELYVQDLAECIFKECKLDDGGVDLYARYSRRSLTVGSETFTIFSDKEGRKRTGEIAWILQCCKHRFDTRYKQGDIQMVASMIAACQDNFAKNHGILEVKVLYGIKVVGEEFYFFSINFNENYIRELAEKLPSHDLIARKYPISSGLRISRQEERRKLVCFLHQIRVCSLSNANF